MEKDESEVASNIADSLEYSRDRVVDLDEAVTVRGAQLKSAPIQIPLRARKAEFVDTIWGDSCCQKSWLARKAAAAELAAQRDRRGCDEEPPWSGKLHYDAKCECGTANGLQRERSASFGPWREPQCNEAPAAGLASSWDLCAYIRKENNSLFSDAEFVALKRYIMCLQDLTPSPTFCPVICRMVRARTSIVFDCLDLLSVEWLQRHLPGIVKVWRFGNIVVNCSRELPRRVGCVFHVPAGIEDDLDFDEKQFRMRLQRANVGVNPDGWYFWNVINHPQGGRAVYYGLDQRSARRLSHGTGLVHYLTGKMQLEVDVDDRN